MKNIKVPIIMLVLIILTVVFLEPITDKIVSILDSNNKIVIQNSNEYKKDYNFKYLQQKEKYIPYSYQDLINIYYSTLNNGWDSFTFYCPKEYKTCLEDVKKISEDSTLLTHINNFVHPFNNFLEVNVSYNQIGETTLKIDKLYSKEEIIQINLEVNKILKDLKLETIKDPQEKIIKVHDFLINNTKYDENFENNTSIYKSNTAFGLLIQNYAICGGYADTMAIFLTELGFQNFKIASETHVWNAVLVNNEWLHLDLTWDDPIDENGKNYLTHKYFLINNKTLKDEDGELTEHTFDDKIYLEFNEKIN